MYAVDVELDLDELVDVESVLPCVGINYVENENATSGWRDQCDRPAEWTRRGHCSSDGAYCDPCKTQLSSWSKHGWIRCHECGAVIWPELLNWRRL